MDTLERDSVDVRIERWRKNLVDISPRNGLLDIKDNRNGCLRMARPSAQEVLDHLVRGKGTYELDMGGPRDDHAGLDRGRILPDADRTKIEKALMVMRTKAREALREQGTNILFLTVGILEWSSEGTGERKLRSPLLMVPVELVRNGPLDPYRLTASGDETTINPTLAYKLSSELRIALPPLPSEGLDVDRYLASVSGLVGRLGWEVKTEVHLGLFRYPKMCMHDELVQSRDIAASHPVIRAIAGQPITMDGLSAPRSEDPELANQRFQVLDADSSQQEAIAMAVAGQSFVLQGPPGTGKSQTIANIIAESLARGRTVLFVSEKLAALEVVGKRLRTRGLGDYCLELHRHDQGRQEVIEELSRCLNPPQPLDASSLDLAELERLSGILDGYVDALHRKRDGLGLSFHEVLSELSRLRTVPEVLISFPNLERMGRRDLEALQPLVRDIERYAPALARREEHPWSDCLVDSWKLSAQSEIVHRLSDLKSARNRLTETLGPICQDLGISMPSSLAETSRLIDHIRMVCQSTSPLPRWLESDPSSLIAMAEDMRESYAKFGLRMAWLRSRYHEDILSIDLVSMQGRFQSEYGKLSRMFSLHYRSDIGQLTSLSRVDRKISYEEAKEDIDEMVKTSAMANHIHALEAECSATLGRYFQGESTDWTALTSSLSWARSYFVQHGRPSSPQLAAVLCGKPSEHAEMRGRLDSMTEAALRLESAFTEVGKHFDMATMSKGAPVHEVPFDDITVWAQAHLDTAASFQEWAEMGRVKKEGTQSGLDDLLTLSSARSLPSDLWPAVQKRFYTLWHDAILSSDRALRSFSRETHERAVADFVSMDKRLPDHAAAAAKVLLDKRRQELCEASAIEQGSGLWVLRHEVSRKKRLRPLRELFSQAAEPVLTLKPCLLMSPLSVSTYLDPAKVHFDLVIFDEASQVRPEDAIGSIMRGSQLIVVGDSKQLPPTDFFRDQAEDEDVPDLESILDECSSTLPQRMLRWHYRSRQESLIAFSNQRFYSSQLRTFPSAARDREGLGVNFVHVADGRYDRSRTRKNVREAEVVADLIVDHLSRRSDESLGVVAFSEPQQMAIIEGLQRRMERDPVLSALADEDGPNGLFVKNLENVQGDERDVMIFSVGYGKDEGGKLVHNYGPLNRPGGERRLNVAITRARKHIKLVSSLLPEEIEPSTPGTSALREYMEYVIRRGDEEAASRSVETTPIEREVAERLRSRGYEVDAQVGHSLTRVDIGVKDLQRPGNYLMGILLDGLGYRSAGSTRDRERLRLEVLSGLGWKVVRLWSQDWTRDQDTEMERIISSIEKAKEEAKQAEEEEAKARVARAEVAVPEPPVLVVDTKAEVSEYVRASFAHDEAMVQAYRADAAGAMATALTAVVNTEGPVHMAAARDRLRELAEAATGKKTVVTKAVAAAVNELVSSGAIRVEGEFLWPASMAIPPVRRSTNGRRDIAQVCDAELEAMVLSVVPDNCGADLGSVVAKVAAMLGYKKPTSTVRSRIETVVDTMQKSGAVVAEGTELSSPAETASKRVSPHGDPEEACP